MQSGGLAHQVADDADDRHQDTAADTTASNAGHNRTQVQPAARLAPAAEAEHSEKLAAQPAAENSDNGVPDRSKAELFEHRPSDVTTDRTAGELND